MPPNPLLDEENNPNASVSTMELELFNSIQKYDILIFSDLPLLHALNTHFPFQRLSALLRSCSSECKIVYITCNPRDTFFSLCKLYKKLGKEGFPVPKEMVWFDGFFSGSAIHSNPFAKDVLGCWHESKSNLRKFMFISYEDLQADCVVWVKRLGRFIGCSPHLVEENTKRVAQICSFDNVSNMEGNRSGITFENMLRLWNGHFFRKESVGELKKYFMPAMEDCIYKEIEQKLNNEDLHLT